VAIGELIFPAGMNGLVGSEDFFKKSSFMSQQAIDLAENNRFQWIRLSLNGVRVICLLLLLTNVIAIGCSKPMIAEQTVASAEQNLSSAIESFNQSDFAKSEQLATAAIDSRGLPVDLYAKALLVRAASRGAASKYDEALADLQEASLGAPDMDQVHGMRSLIMRQRGDTAAATEEATTAKKFNPAFKIPQNLKKWTFTL